MYTKTHGYQLLVDNLYAEGKTAIHKTNIYLYNAILQLIIRRKLFQSLEKFRDYQLIRKNRETFPPRTICNIRYTSNPKLIFTLAEASEIPELEQGFIAALIFIVIIINNFKRLFH